MPIMLHDQLKKIQEEALLAFQTAKDTKQLYDCKVKYLGKSGLFSGLMKQMGSLSKEERPLFGKEVNIVKAQIEESYEKHVKIREEEELRIKLSNERVDMTLPGLKRSMGAIHPIHLVIREIVDILSHIGFSVRTGFSIEHDRFNFEALNIPADHPARDMQDTFYIDEFHALRPHTSPIQIHTLLNEAPPIRVLAPGPVYRCDSDVSHSPHFHQIECLLVDHKVSMADLKGTISYFVRGYFGQDIKTRFRPSFFPFTEPSAEVDCSCPICKGKGCRMCGQSGWIEIGGSGLVNPNVFKHCGIEYPKWQGFAFGFGIERMAIIKYGIEDIRLFFENDIRFLEQF